MSMRLFSGLLVLVVLLAGTALYLSGREPQPQPDGASGQDPSVPRDTGSERVVLDISVHTLEELRVLLDRAEQLSAALNSEHASVVLVLHGPEVEFFASANYRDYRDVVDQAERLDANGIVDVKICQAMMKIRGVPRKDIPAFIEQVPDGQEEIERLVGEGFVYF